MLNVAVWALVIALVAGVLGFGGIASAATGVALVVFYIFIGLFVLSLVAMAWNSARRSSI
ncbi:MAG: DUF1328 domain-containing protein [Proteobacteria bacterium]|nr:DUF1328 domain-containing protein [Pseudomonadota bacterium]